MIVGICGGLVVVAGIAFGVFAFLHRGHDYPSHWDDKVAPIAARVEQLRGLTFKHPVPVNYLSAADFEKKVSADPAELKKEHKQIEQISGLFRAAGLIGGKVDLGKATNDTQAADTLAFYDPDTKAIYVRGNGAFTVETRVTLAHELTHVLQDQYFDLPKLQKKADKSKTGSSDAFTALIEGDAEHVKGLYLASQTAADKKEYDRLSNSTNDTIRGRTDDIPAVVETIFGAPYIFGPQVVGILDSTGGNNAVNDAITGPTPSTRIYLDPTALTEAPEPPAIPALHAGEKKFSTGSSGDDSFDDFTLYLMLGARIDRPAALEAADAYSSGSEVLYTHAGKTCFRAAIAGRDLSSEAFLRTAIRRWTAAMPDAAVDPGASAVVFHSCDPGKTAKAPSDAAINEATSFAATRAALTKELVTKEHATATLATCAARLFFESPTLRGSVFGQTTASPDELRTQGTAAGIACRRDPNSGMP
jgi:hypothetical protein